MNNNRGFNFFLVIIAFVTGSKLVSHTDFKNWTFEKPAIDTLYLIVFLLSVFFIVWELIKRLKK